MTPEELESQLTNIIWEAMDEGIDESEIKDIVEDLIATYEPLREESDLQ